MKEFRIIKSINTQEMIIHFISHYRFSLQDFSCTDLYGGGHGTDGGGGGGGGHGFTTGGGDGCTIGG